MPKQQQATTQDLLQVEGAVTIRAFEKGAIQQILDRKPGVHLGDAIKLAEQDHKLVAVRKRHNLVTNIGKNLVAKVLADTESTGITFVALGDGTAGASISDTKLMNERARLQVTSRSVNSAVLSISTYFMASQCTFFIHEVGYFGGSLAGPTKDSGTLFSRIMNSFDNSAGIYDLTVEYTLTVS